jgi:hypothetical protein
MVVDLAFGSAGPGEKCDAAPAGSFFDVFSTLIFFMEILLETL